MVLPGMFLENLENRENLKMEILPRSLDFLLMVYA